MEYKETRREIELLAEKLTTMENLCQQENRQPYKAEKQVMRDIKNQIEHLKKTLPEDRLTMPGPQGRVSKGTSTDNGGFDSMGEILAALYRKSNGEGFDNRLKPLQISASAQIGETVPSEGGFAIPTMFVERALNEDLLDTVLLQLCDRQTMTANDMTVPAFQDDDHSTTAPFGITWAQIAEGSSFGSTQGTPFRAMNLSAKKSGALFAVNNEWLTDSSTGVRQRLENIWRASLRWYVEDLLWVGTGSGEALGALVGDGAVSIAIEGGQAQTILTENVTKMWARLRPGSHNRAIWACNATCFPNLASLSISVGLSGSATGLLQVNSSGIAGAPATSIFGRPLYMCEHLPSLGYSGDLVLLDPLLYMLGDRKQIVLDVSPHLKFDYDQTVFRASARIDGQPIYSSPLTPKNGDTCGWLVKIDDRI